MVQGEGAKNSPPALTSRCAYALALPVAMSLVQSPKAHCNECVTSVDCRLNVLNPNFRPFNFELNKK